VKRREIRPTQSGELRHICNIEQMVMALDASGTPTATYQLWATNVFFAIDDWKPIEQLQAQELGHNLNTRIRMRWRPGVVESMRLAYCTNPGYSPQVWEYYEIVGIVRDIAMRVEMQLTCVKRTAAGFRRGITGIDAGLGGSPSETFEQFAPPGPQGPPGPTGAAAQTFTFDQNTPAAAWTIVHNLGRFPAVTVVDSSEREVEGDVAYIDSNRLTVTFSAPFSGVAYLN
jgi:head-tail adaptor